MEFTALENKLKKKEKKTEEETNADYSFPTPCYEQLITCEIVRNFLAAVIICTSQTIPSTFRELDHKHFA